MDKTIKLTALITDESAVVEVVGPTASGPPVSATGWSKKHPKDAPDASVGHDLAVARALRELADKYESRATETMDRPPIVFATGGYIDGHTTTTLPQWSY